MFGPKAAEAEELEEAVQRMPQAWVQEPGGSAASSAGGT